MERTPLSHVIGQPVCLQPDPAMLGRLVLVRENGAVVAQLHEDDLFDADGNHFERDLES